MRDRATIAVREIGRNNHVGEQTNAHRTGTCGRTSDRTHARPLGGTVTSAVCGWAF